MSLENDILELTKEQFNENINLDDLETKLYLDLDNDFCELEILKEQKEKIGNPDALGDVIKNVIWEQFQNQIGVQVGEDFIDDNRGMTLDLRTSAHIQTIENFEKGKIATHNDKIDYQKRYDEWQGNFQKDEKGNIKMTYDRIDKELKPTLIKGYRKPYDDGREKGSVALHMDETVSVAEQVRDAEANAHLDLDERIKFDQSDKNLNSLDSSANQSKSDHKMKNWLESERNGKKPAERFNIDEQQLREKDKEARKEYEKVKEQGKEHSIKTGRQSQKEEALRIGKSAVRAVVMQLLADMLKEIVSKLVKWFKSKNKQFKTLVNSIKDAIHSLFQKLKSKVINAGSTLATTIATSIIGPIVGTIKKVWIFLKQGWSSLKQAVDFLRSPEAKTQPFEIVMLEVGKIIMGALTAGGAIALGEVIEKGLMTIPVFNIQIPLLGSLANILGIFLAAVVTGIIGAITLDIIDKIIAKKQKLQLQIQVATQTDVVLKGQALKTWQKLEGAYETVGTITERTIENLKESVQSERDSLNTIDDALRELDVILGK